MRSAILILVSTFMLSLSSCTIYSGGQMVHCSSSDYSQEKIKRIRVESEPTTYFLGFGGHSSKGLMNEAKQELNRRLKNMPGAQVKNISFEYKNGYYLVFQSKKLIMYADVVWDNENVSTGPKELNGFKVGETVYFKKTLLGASQVGVIQGFESNKVRVKNKSNDNEFTIDISLVEKY